MRHHCEFIIAVVAIVAAGCNSSSSPENAGSERRPVTASLSDPKIVVDEAKTVANDAKLDSSNVRPAAIDATSTTNSSKPAAIDAKPTTKDSWVPFISEEGNYAVRFPVEPLKRDSVAADGTPRHNVLAIVDNGRVLYSIQYVDGAPPDDARQALAQRQAGMLKTLRGVLLKEKEIRIGDWYGRAFSYMVNTKIGPDIQHVRVCLIDGRIYILTVSGHPDQVNEDDADRFFDSFVLRKK